MTELKPWVRIVVTAYVLCVVPLLAFSTLMALIHAPRMFATAYDSLAVQYDKVSSALDDGAAISVGSGTLQMLMLALPTVGLVLTSGRVGARAGQGAWRWSAGRPGRRAGVVTVGGAAIALAAFTWWPNCDYRPIQPAERGTIEGRLHSVTAIHGGRPGLTPERERDLGGAPTARERTGDRRIERVPDSVGPRQRPAKRRTPRRERGRHRRAATPADATPGGSADAAPRGARHTEASGDPGCRRAAGPRHAEGARRTCRARGADRRPDGDPAKPPMTRSTLPAATAAGLP